MDSPTSTNPNQNPLSSNPATPPVTPPVTNTMPTTPPPIPPKPPSPATDQPSMGVGTPNIGVEKNLDSASKDTPKPPDEKPEEKPEENKNDFSLVDPPKPEMSALEKKPTEEIPAQNAINDNKDPNNNKIEVELTPQTPINIKHYNEKEKPPQTIPAPPKPPTPASTPPPMPPERPLPPVPPVPNGLTSEVTPPPQPPIKASSGTNAALTAMIIVALLIGSVGGFFGFRYFDKTKITASSEITPASTGSSEEASATNTSLWPVYTSSLYNFTLKYPNGWFTNTTDPQAQSVVFASNKESLEGTPSGFKIDIASSDLSGKTLKEWVDSNSTVTAEKNKPKEITISDQTAYQQQLTKNGSQVATYIEQPGKVVIVTYTAPTDQFAVGGDFYNNLINSIKLM